MKSSAAICFLLSLTLVSTSLNDTYQSSLIDDDDLSDENKQDFLIDPSSNLDLGQMPGEEHVSQTIPIAITEVIDCPPSCFCELEESYASCIGDGQWAPPLLPSTLSRIELRNFQIKVFDTANIKLPNIFELKIQQCNLTYLHSDALRLASRLDRLDLSQNLLKALNENEFRGLMSLKHLDLSSNLLSNLSLPFAHLESLEHLNLRNNKLTQLNANTFIGLRKVQYVNIDSNLIQSIDIAAFQHLSSLAHLILSNNPLSKLSRLNFFGSRLQYIDVTNIGVSNVPQALTQFVKDLRLSNNNITEIHRGDLDSYPYLGLLVLDENGLEVLEEDSLGRHEFLGRLWLNKNNLKVIPQSLPISLRALYLEENRITFLNDSDFSNLVNLEKLILKNNEIVDISAHAFHGLVSVKILDLQINRLANLSLPIFAPLDRLERLDLSQNPITCLSEYAFVGLNLLNVLHMSKLPLKMVMSKEAFKPLKTLQVLTMHESPNLVEIVMNSSTLLGSIRGLKELNLMNNHLTNLRDDFFSFFPKMTLIKLGGNSWNCSDRNKTEYLKHRMTNSPINFYKSFTVRCDTPVSLALKPIILLQDSDFINDKTNSTNSKSEDIYLNDKKTEVFIEQVAINNNGNLTIANSTESLDTTMQTDVVSTSQIPEPTDDDYMNAMPNLINDVDEEYLYMNEDEFEEDNYELTKTSKSMIESSLVKSSNQSTLFSTTLSSTSILPTKFSSSKMVPILKSPVTPLLASMITSSSSVGNAVSNAVLANETKLEISKLLIEKPPTTLGSYWEMNNRKERSSKLANVSLKPQSLTSLVGSNSQNEENKHEDMTLVITERSEDQFRKKSSLSPVSNYLRSKELWLYKGDSSHSVQGEQSEEHGRKNVHWFLVAGEILTACLGVSLIFAAYILVRNIFTKHRRNSNWEHSCTSYWQGRNSNDQRECLSEDLVAGSDESEGSISLIAENHLGLSNRLYLLLQRDTSTGITPESLPDPNSRNSSLATLQPSQVTQLHSLSSLVI